MIPSTEDDTAVFYNPVQVQNRDLSILMITLFAERRAVRQVTQDYYQTLKKEQQQTSDLEKEGPYRRKTLDELQAKVKDYEKTLSGRALVAQAAQQQRAETSETSSGGLSILDALAASGLRSLRYWKEIPGIHHITINDLDAAAVQRARDNLVANQLGPVQVMDDDAAVVPTSGRCRPRGIAIQQGDAKDEMYASRVRFVAPNTTTDTPPPGNKFPILPPWDVIDLDPYGSASPFLDAAIQAVTSGGLLCVTCTDMAALGGSHPETSFGRYAAFPLQRAGYLQEMAIRILLWTIATTSAKYGRTMRPILSVGMNFYVRVFVEIHDDKAGVNDLSLQTGYVYQSTHCPSFRIMKAGQMGGKKGTVYQAGRAPGACEETGSNVKVGGPMWLGPMHDTEVVTQALRRLEGVNDEGENQDLPPAPDLQWIATKDRLRGLLESCREELSDAPLFYKVQDLAQTLHCATPPLLQVKAALVNAGYRVSGYHKEPQAIKTDAPNQVIWDILRVWYKHHPPKKHTPAIDTAASKILGVEAVTKVDFDTKCLEDQKQRNRGGGIARFPLNPEKNWGPKPKASGRTGKKRQAAEASTQSNEEHSNADDNGDNHPNKRTMTGD